MVWQLRTALIGATLLIASCAPKSEFTYSGPAERLIENERIVDLAFEPLWDKYVGELSQSFFVINKIEKASRIISVSFSTDSPGDYVDCGTNRSNSNPVAGQRIFSFAVAESTTFEFSDPSNQKWAVNRVTRLEVRANIYLAPKTPDRTLVRANAKFVLKVGAIARRADGRQVSNSFINDFSTNNPGSRRDDGITWTCRSLGVLEEQLLALADSG